MADITPTTAESVSSKNDLTMIRDVATDTTIFKLEDWKRAGFHQLVVVTDATAGTFVISIKPPEALAGDDFVSYIGSGDLKNGPHIIFINIRASEIKIEPSGYAGTKLKLFLTSSIQAP